MLKTDYDFTEICDESSSESINDMFSSPEKLSSKCKDVAQNTTTIEEEDIDIEQSMWHQEKKRPFDLWAEIDEVKNEEQEEIQFD